MSQHNQIDYFTGIVTGLLIGIALGFIFAPKSGHETRELIKQKAYAAKDIAAELPDKVRKVAKAASEMGHKLET